MAACKGLGIEFLQSLIRMDWSDRWGRPGSVDVVPIQDIPGFLRIDDPWITQMDGSQEMVQGPIEIAALNEIPYYARHKDRIKRHYNKTKEASVEMSDGEVRRSSLKRA